MISEESCMVLCEARYLAGRVDTESVTESLCVCVCVSQKVSVHARVSEEGVRTLCQTLLRREWENETNKQFVVQWTFQNRTPCGFFQALTSLTQFSL